MSLAVLALVTDAWGGRGGIAQYNRDFLGALAGCGDVGDVTVLPRNAPDADTPPAGIVQLPARGGRIVYSLAAVSAALTRRVDVVFCGHLYMAPLARAVARLKGAKLVLQTHGVEAWPQPKSGQRAAAEASDLVLAVSRHTRSAIQGWAAMAPERLIVVPNTVGEAYTPAASAAFREAFGLEGRRVLLTVGRMSAAERYKGHDRVIEAMTTLGPDVTYAVIGEGDDRPRLEALAAACGMANRVHFLGAQPADMTLSAYREADLFVMPSTGEGFGIVFLEAMACGTPALGLGVAGARDALADGALGIASTEAALAADIARALSSPRPQREDLAQKVRTAFGHEAFRSAVGGVAERFAAT